MPIFFGLLALCAFFIVFGSKTEEASVIYYDPPDTPMREAGEEDELEPVEQATENVPADAPAQVDSKETAQSIYDSIDL